MVIFDTVDRLLRDNNLQPRQVHVPSFIIKWVQISTVSLCGGANASMFPTLSDKRQW